MARSNLLREITGKGLEKTIYKPHAKIKVGIDGRVHAAQSEPFVDLNDNGIDDSLEVREDLGDDYEDELIDEIVEMEKLLTSSVLEISSPIESSDNNLNRCYLKKLPKK